MGWRMVQQPNGLLARFDEGIDDFTHSDMTPLEAEVLCRQYVGELEAKGKVQRGIDAGIARFTEAIDVIRMVHGDNVADERKQEMSTPVQKEGI